MKNIILGCILLMSTSALAETPNQASEVNFLDDVGGYLIFGERLDVPSIFRRQNNKDDCARYADLELNFRFINYKQFSIFLAGREETFMAGTHELFFSAPVFQDYYFSLSAVQNLKFIKPEFEFCHLCAHHVDTLPPGDSVESWERLQLNCVTEIEWKKGPDYPAGNFSAEFGLAKYFPLDDCDWRYGLNYNAQFSLFLTDKIRPFASLSDEIKFAAQSPKQTKPEFRLGITFKGKLANLALISVMSLDSDKSSGMEIKIFK